MGRDCALVTAAQQTGGRSSVAWTIDIEYAHDGEEPAVSVIAGGISQEETVRVVWVTYGHSIPERVPTETVGVMMVDHNGRLVRNQPILVWWVHPTVRQLT